jgi:hypothetical protein
MRLTNPNLEVVIVDKGKAKQEFLKFDEKSKFLGTTNIPNPNYKKTIFNLF